MQLRAPGGARPVAARPQATQRAVRHSTTRSTADFGRNCLLARRLLERGVRFVQVWSGAGGPNEQLGQPHRHPRTSCPPIARQVDQPIAALLADLKARGLLDDTLVIWTTEFGRMPFTQGGDRPRPQRRHVRHLAGRRRRQGRRRPRRERRVRSYQAADGHDVLLRPARHDPAPAGHRPRAADLPPQRHRPPADRRARPRDRRRSWRSRCRVGQAALRSPTHHVAGRSALEDSLDPPDKRATAGRSPSAPAPRPGGGGAARP